MYEFRNPHPHGKIVGDCVKRAITIATESDYREVSRELNRIKREIECKSFTEKPVYKEYMKRHNFEKLSFPAVKGRPRMNGERFCESYPEGRYILNMAGHLSCCVDGIIYDTWDCSDKCVYNAFKVS